MKARVHVGRCELALRDEPDPVPGAGDALVRVEAVGICGSDMHAYHGMDERRPAPLILGHEAAGRVMAPLYDVLLDTPEIAPAMLERFAKSLRRAK